VGGEEPGRVAQRHRRAGGAGGPGQGVVTARRPMAAYLRASSCFTSAGSTATRRKFACRSR
jgi:hypothetical protein